jgi:hypothetical protein
MDRCLESSEGRNAARFAAIYAVLQRRTKAPPPWTPRFLAPLSLDALVQACRPLARNPGEEPAEQYRARRTVVAALAGARVDDAIWKALMYPTERATLERICDDGGKGGSDDDCEYCNAARALAVTRGRDDLLTQAHAPIEIDFDPDTFVSTARVIGLEVLVPSSHLPELFRRADPRNWASDASDFFKRSEPGIWARGGWHGPRAWQEADRGQIYEVALAQLNERIAFEIHNILDITDFRNDLAGRQVQRADDRLEVGYAYALQQNLASKLGFIWEPEGIDIDNGRYRAEAVRVGANGGGSGGVGREDRWRVTISVDKRLRYAVPQAAPAEIGPLLNVMAPAFLSLFMHEQVYSTLRDLNGAQGGAAPAAP